MPAFTPSPALHVYFGAKKMSGIVINMDPAIFRLGTFEFRWYGLMILIAAIAGTAILVRRAMKRGISRDNIYSLLPWVFVGGILGARLFHVVDNYQYYWENPLLILQFQMGGLAIWGAMVGGALVAAIYCHSRKIPFGRLLDAAVPALLVAQIIGRVGCIINGDAYGGITDLPWAFIYTNPHALVPTAYLGLPTHPYPVYEMIWNGVALLGIWRLERFFKRDGLTNCSKETMEETGFPGSPKAGFPPMVPKARGFPGFMATFQKTISIPRSLRTSLTRS